MPPSQAQVSGRSQTSRFGHEKTSRKVKKHRHSSRRSSDTSSSSEDEILPPKRKSPSFNATLKRGLAVLLPLMLLLCAAWIGAFPQLYRSAVERASSLVSAVQQELPSLFTQQTESVPVAVVKRDFALETEGGSVTCSLTTGCSLWPFSLWNQPPSLAIRESVHSEECWRIHAQHGQLGVVLGQPIHPTHVTIEHLSSQVATDINEAPRSMILWGLVDGEGNIARHDSMNTTVNEEGISDSPLARQAQTFVPLAAFSYDIHRATSQTFAVYNHIRSSQMDFTTVVLEIRNNWGSQNTCLCRMRIHGEPERNINLSEQNDYPESLNWCELVTEATQCVNEGYVFCAGLVS